MEEMKELYLALYSPSSVQRLLDFLKTVYAVNNVVPVVIKPFGAAAQVGVPEAHRISYKLSKPLIILPEIMDLKKLLSCEAVYYVSEEGEEVDLPVVFNEVKQRKTAVIISSGEQEPGKRELEDIKTIWFKNIPRGMPSIAVTGIILYEVNRLKNINQ
ncbi:MAG: RecB-family nuclease [Desulfurococcaceae archaeon]